VLRTITYLTDRRDGRAAQQINVTQLGVTITADEIEQARAIVRELRRGVPSVDSAAPFLEESPAERD